MKQYLLKKGNWYKANLHCHTTVSDGRFSPEEIKKIYSEKGYSIVIGHVGSHGGENTSKAIKDTISEIQDSGVDIVFLSDIYKLLSNK